MSNARFSASFVCRNGCQPGPECPGHTLAVDFAYTSDTVAFYIAGERFVIDRALWDALMNIGDQERRR